MAIIRSDISTISRYPQVWSIDKKEIYDLLEKKGKLGGPSIVFHRYHEVGKTKISRATFNTKTNKWSVSKNGKWVGQITGFDANALYLWCLGQEMPTGKMEHLTDVGVVTQQIKSGELFGFVELDIHVPKNLYTYFAEMPPIFKNIEIDPTLENVGEYTFNLRTQLKCDNNNLANSLVP
eukprot:Lithocolla_globosa_v1_NODE_3122_length_1759_cov_57.233568.p2 type:complete len:179 gc:universal NODE_3122_length_1759_cov_57.233568:98-634(+)